VPYPESRFEFGVAYYVSGLAEEVAMRSFVESSHARFAAIAQKHVEAPPSARAHALHRVLLGALEPAARQEMLNLWVTIARRSFGRTDSPHDAQALKLGLKNRRAADLDRVFCENLQPFLERCGLVLPTLEG
jgi:1,2-phenylacetyl-CoA epoxidase catalytic subunit